MINHKIYISYAEADEDWVTGFASVLRGSLCKQFGEIDREFIWARYKLSGIGDTDKMLEEHLQSSTYMMVILSPAYMREIEETEINKFKNSENIIVVEHDDVEYPESLKDKKGYRFWKENERGNIIQYSKDKEKGEYQQIIQGLARDIKNALGSLEDYEAEVQQQKESDKDNQSGSHITIMGDVISSNINIGDNTVQAVSPETGEVENIASDSLKA